MFIIVIIINCYTTQSQSGWTPECRCVMSSPYQPHCLKRPITREIQNIASYQSITITTHALIRSVTRELQNVVLNDPSLENYKTFVSYDPSLENYKTLSYKMCHKRIIKQCLMIHHWRNTKHGRRDRKQPAGIYNNWHHSGNNRLHSGNIWLHTLRRNLTRPKMRTSCSGMSCLIATTKPAITPWKPNALPYLLISVQ
jgi:hypothetical protein